MMCVPRLNLGYRRTLAADRQVCAQAMPKETGHSSCSYREGIQHQLLQRLQIHPKTRKAEKSNKPKDVFVKQYYEPGQECEFDWGEVKLLIGWQACYIHHGHICPLQQRRQMGLSFPSSRQSCLYGIASQFL